MDSKKGAITSDQMDVGMCLVLIHLREGGKKIMIMFRGGRVTMGGLGPMDEGHDESSGGRKVVFGGVDQGCGMVLVCQKGESLLCISTLVSKQLRLKP